MIRFLVIIILVVGFLILSIPILFLEWLIGKWNPRFRDLSSLRIVQFMFKLILKVAGTKVTVIGEEQVPTDTPVLYIGNHRSFFDILVTYSRCPDLTGYVAKISMEKIPAATRAMHSDTAALRILSIFSPPLARRSHPKEDGRRGQDHHAVTEDKPSQNSQGRGGRPHDTRSAAFPQNVPYASGQV